MPTYEYRCKGCGRELEAVQSFSDPSLTVCPHCGGPLRKVFGSIGITFKGDGFYKNDSRSSSKKSSASKSNGDSSSSSGDHSHSHATQPLTPSTPPRRRRPPELVGLVQSSLSVGSPGRRAARATDRARGRRRVSAVGPLPSSMTSRRSRSTRRTATSAPSPSATSAAAAARSSPGTAQARLPPHRIPYRATCGRCELGVLVIAVRRRPCRRTRTRANRRGRPARRSHLGQTRHVLRRTRGPPRVVRRSIRRRDAIGARRRGPQARAPRPRRRHDGRRPRAALLDPCRVALVHVDGMRGHQHDRPSRGRARGRAGDPLRGGRADHRLRRRARRRGRCRAGHQEMVFAFFEGNIARAGRLFEAIPSLP